MRYRNYYILDKYGNPQPEPDVIKWAKWFEEAHKTGIRIVKKTVINKEISVSTVFLGINHNFVNKESPILYETMVFGGKLDGEMERYYTKGQAIVGHDEMVERIKRGRIKQFLKNLDVFLFQLFFGVVFLIVIPALLCYGLWILCNIY